MPVALDVLTSVPDVLGEGPVYDPSTGVLFRDRHHRAGGAAAST